MSIPLSEGILYTNPVPAQQWSRKLQSGITYVDWDSTTEVDTFFANTTGLSPTYKLNKYFWIAGNLYQYTQDGYRLVGDDVSNPGVKSDVFNVLDFTNTIDTGLINKELIMTFIGGTTPPVGAQVYDAITITMDADGVLDGTLIGGFYSDNNVTILYK